MQQGIKFTEVWYIILLFTSRVSPTAGDGGSPPTSQKFAHSTPHLDKFHLSRLPPLPPHQRLIHSSSGSHHPVKNLLLSKISNSPCPLPLFGKPWLVLWFDITQIHLLTYTQKDYIWIWIYINSTCYVLTAALCITCWYQKITLQSSNNVFVFQKLLTCRSHISVY